jgi:TonB family protein
MLTDRQQPLSGEHGIRGFYICKYESLSFRFVLTSKERAIILASHQLGQSTKTAAMNDKTNPETWKITLRGAFLLCVFALLLSPTPDEARQLFYEKDIAKDQAALSRYSLKFTSVRLADKTVPEPKPNESASPEQKKVSSRDASSAQNTEQHSEAKKQDKPISSERKKNPTAPAISEVNAAPPPIEIAQRATKTEEPSVDESPAESPATQNDSTQNINVLGNNTRDTAPLVKTPLFKSPPTPPPYPVMARRRGQEGVVLLEIWLDEQGKQTQLAIKTSSGNQSLDASAMTSVKQWSFQPHSIDGLSVASRVHIPIRFQLN